MILSTTDELLEMGLDDGKDMQTLEDLKTELKQMKADGNAPEWFTSLGWQTIRNSYLWRDGGERTVRDAHVRIAKGAAKYLPEHLRKIYELKFFNILWNGWLIPSSPVFSNLGTNRGLAVSCSGQYVPDDLYGIGMSEVEAAMLTKFGFGTSAYYGDLRSRGANIKGTGGKSNGSAAYMKHMKEKISDTSQGGTRRGAFAGYTHMLHGDFDEILDWFKANHDKFSLGLVVTEEFLELCRKGDKEALRRRKKALELRRQIGSPYFVYVDKMNKLNPKKLVDLGLLVVASNLCTEITLPANKDYSFSCVLSSMNAYKYDEWAETDAIETAIVFLDCVAEDLIQRGKSIRGMEKIVAFTERARALGLGLLGYHSYLQKKRIAFESLEANYVNARIFKNMKEKAVKASKMLGELLGVPEWCEDGMRNTHFLAVAPNTTSAHLAGSISQGIEPWVGNYFVQPGSKGTLLRINPECIELLKSYGKYDKETLAKIRDAAGSVQGLDFLTQHEKDVFKTAYEIDQMVILRQAEQRQKYICQGQSLNLFFPKTGDDWTQEQIHDLNQYIDDCHSYAEDSDWIKALYYVRSQAGLAADTGRSACLACEG